MVGDGFHFVLAKDVSAEEGVSVQRQRGGVSFCVEDNRFFANRAGDEIAKAVARLDVEFNATALQIALHQGLHAPPCGGREVFARERVERVSDQFEQRGLARAARADNAIESWSELDTGTVEKAANNHQRDNSVDLHETGLSPRSGCVPAGMRPV